MNKLEFELLNGYLEQLSFKAQNTISELQLVQRHIGAFKLQLTKRDISDKTRLNIPVLDYKSDTQKTVNTHPHDLLRMKDVLQMTGLSKSSIYTYRSNDEFPQPIQLGARSVAWVRSDVDQWILDKINNR